MFGKTSAVSLPRHEEPHPHMRNGFTDMSETKHEKFLRLMQKRLERTLEDFRMISQLASTNYRNTPTEAHEVVLYLDRGVKAVASSFDISYKTWVGDPNRTKQIPAQLGQINEIDAAKAIALIQAGVHQDAVSLLKAAINKDPR